MNWREVTGETTSHAARVLNGNVASVFILKRKAAVTCITLSNDVAVALDLKRDMKASAWVGLDDKVGKLRVSFGDGPLRLRATSGKSKSLTVWMGIVNEYPDRTERPQICSVSIFGSEVVIDMPSWALEPPPLVRDRHDLRPRINRAHHKPSNAAAQTLKALPPRPAPPRPVVPSHPPPAPRPIAIAPKPATSAADTKPTPQLKRESQLPAPVVQPARQAPPAREFTYQFKDGRTIVTLSSSGYMLLETLDIAQGKGMIPNAILAQRSKISDPQMVSSMARALNLDLAGIDFKIEGQTKSGWWLVDSKR